MCGLGSNCGYCIAKTDVCRLCEALTRTRGRGLETFPKAMHFLKSLGSNKNGKVFRVLSQLKKLSKSNDFHVQNKTFLSSCNELLLPLKIRLTEGGDITFIH